jgi:hypothetical protein
MNYSPVVGSQLQNYFNKNNAHIIVNDKFSYVEFIIIVTQYHRRNGRTYSPGRSMLNSPIAVIVFLKPSLIHRFCEMKLTPVVRQAHNRGTVSARNRL